MSAVSPQLIQAAREARDRAYAPYSAYRVGAAVLDELGRIWPGCNMENVSYGLSLCAERAAVSRLVSEGGREVRAIALATEDGGTPCGMCLQTLLEFASDPAQMLVVCSNLENQIREFTLADLIPHGFDSKAVRRTG